MSSAHFVRTTREALLRPLMIVSGIVERRHRMPHLGDLLREEGKATPRHRAVRKADSAAQEQTATGAVGGQVAAGAAADGSAGGDGGDGDGDSDGPRRRSRSLPASPSVAARRTPSLLTAPERAHRAALTTLVLLAVLAFAMAFFLAVRGHLWLAGEVIGALGGLPYLARALVRPK
jgi:hypothetical protein